MADNKLSDSLKFISDGSRVVRVVSSTDTQIGSENSPAELQITGRFAQGTVVLDVQPGSTVAIPSTCSVLCLNISSVGSGDVSVALPVTSRKGLTYSIKDFSGRSGTNNIVISAAQSGALIDGQTTKRLSNAYESNTFVWTGSTWTTIGGSSQVVATVASTSSTGGTGPTGPTGPAGPTGATGATGATGPGASPGGSNEQVQFNDGGSFGGNSNLTFNKAAGYLRLTGSFAQGGGNSKATGQYSYAGGYNTNATGQYSHTEGEITTASGPLSHAEGYNTWASDNNSHAEGDSTIASGQASHAEGKSTTASGLYSHAEGQSAIASSTAAHAEGKSTTASGLYSHAEGESSKATGPLSHAQGYNTTANNNNTHAEGNSTIAAGNSSHAEGYLSVASGSYSHAGGEHTIASGSAQTTIGKYNKRNNDFSLFVIGDGTGDANANRSDIVRVNSGSSIGLGRVEVTGSFASTLGISGSLTRLVDGTSYLVAGTNVTITSASNGSVTISSTGGTGTPASPTNSVQFNSAGSFGGDSSFSYDSTLDRLHLTGSFSQGNSTKAQGLYSYAGGQQTLSSGDHSHSEGYFTTGSGEWSHAEGYYTIASGDNSHAEGKDSQSDGSYSHAEGRGSFASGIHSHAEGSYTKTLGESSHAEGYFATGSGDFSHAEGHKTEATGYASHSEGSGSLASGEYAHAEGETSVASGKFSHAEGQQTNASGEYSHSEGGITEAIAWFSHAEGQDTHALGQESHTEGYLTYTYGYHSHAEGLETKAYGDGSHAEGWLTEASGTYSHAEGLSTISSGSYQHVQGKYNKRGNDFSLFVIGDGTGDSNANRSDIVRVNPGAAGGLGRVEVTGSFAATQGISGSLTKLVDGTSYIIAGNNLNVITGSSGAVTIGTTFGIGTNGQVLTMTGGSPGWSNPSGGSSIFNIAQSINSTQFPHTTWTVVGTTSAAIPTSGTKTFYAVVAAPAGFTMEVRVTDITAGGTVLTTATTTSTSPTTISNTLTPADATRRMYAVEIRLSGASTPSVNDKGVIYGTTIEVS